MFKKTMLIGMLAIIPCSGMIAADQPAQCPVLSALKKISKLALSGGSAIGTFMLLQLLESKAQGSSTVIADFAKNHPQLVLSANLLGVVAAVNVSDKLVDQAIKIIPSECPFKSCKANS